jgi:uncharacterized RDD family membrane protein YckC
MVYEGVLLFGITVVAASLYYALISVFGVHFVSYAKTDYADLVRFGLMVWMFFVLGFYFVYCWCKSGQTLAMKTWRIRVVDLDGGKLPVVKGVVRYFLAWLWFLPALALYDRFNLPRTAILPMLALGVAAWAMTAVFSKNGQFLHDRLAKTRLVHVELATGVDHKYVM